MRYPLIFAYHDVSPTPRLSGNWVLPGVFKRHISYLLKVFQPLPPHALEFPIPTQGFMITFDDALEGVYRYAYPITEEYGIKGAVFVVTGFIGKRNVWDATFGTSVRHIDRSAILELSDSGWIVGSHTVSHRALISLPEGEIRRELEYSKKYLEDLTGKEVWAVSYPFNLYDRRVLKLAREIGYRWGFSGPSLKAHFTPLNVPRIPVMLIDLTLRHKLLPPWAVVDMLLTAPSRLTPPFMRARELLLNALRRRCCK